VGNPNLVEDIEYRIVNWLLAQLELTGDGKLVHKKKGIATVQEKPVQLSEKKRLVSSSLIGRMTFLVELSATLNTLDAFVASLLRCHRKLVFQMMLGAIRSVIDTRESLKMRLKRKLTQCLRPSLGHTCEVLPKKDHWSYGKLLRIHRRRLT
jgi:hypothetical protein